MPEALTDAEKVAILAVALKPFRDAVVIDGENGEVVKTGKLLYPIYIAARDAYDRVFPPEPEGDA